jgi:hypothetical protein
MKPLRKAVEAYVALRRSLGFKLKDMAPGFLDFAAFLEQKAAPYITTELAMEWAMLPKNHKPSDWAQRLGLIRVFARHWHATDPRTEIPPPGLLPFRPQRARPYLYSEREIERLLAAALKLSPHSGLRPRTYHCLFGLLAVGDLRISEALWNGQMWISARPSSPFGRRSLGRPAWFGCTLPRGMSRLRPASRPLATPGIFALFLSQRSWPSARWFRRASDLL